MKFLNQGFDHVEFVVKETASHEAMYKRLGFTKLGERNHRSRGLKSVLMGQGFIRILLTAPDKASPESTKQEETRFLNAHDEGICVLGVEVENAEDAFKTAVKRGAKPAREPVRFVSEQGSVVRSEIFTPADFRYAFMERRNAKGELVTLTTSNTSLLFDDSLVATSLLAPSPMGLMKIDHLTNNVGMGDMATWVAYYKDVFDFTVTRHFTIKTGRTGLLSDVVESRDRKIKVPINEATEKESQVQEFVERFKGVGVQHLALETTNIIKSLGQFRENGFGFLTVPSAYYQAVPTRVPGVTEDLKELEKLGILLDGEDHGYLLQIFSKELVGPFFLEFIERKGNQGFGEGNFRALFEAIERDQIQRGVLK